MENETTGGTSVGVGRGPDRLTVAEIKELRVELDRILVRVQQSAFLRPKEMVEVRLKESRHWLGECLKELGSELPPEFADKS